MPRAAALCTACTIVVCLMYPIEQYSALGSTELCVVHLAVVHHWGTAPLPGVPLLRVVLCLPYCDALLVVSQAMLGA